MLTELEKLDVERAKLVLGDRWKDVFILFGSTFYVDNKHLDMIASVGHKRARTFLRFMGWISHGRSNRMMLSTKGKILLERLMSEEIITEQDARNCLSGDTFPKMLMLARGRGKARIAILNPNFDEKKQIGLRPRKDGYRRTRTPIFVDPPERRRHRNHLES